MNADGSRHDCRSQKVDQPTNRPEKLDIPSEERIRLIAREEIFRVLVMVKEIAEAEAKKK